MKCKSKRCHIDIVSSWCYIGWRGGLGKKSKKISPKDVWDCLLSFPLVYINIISFKVKNHMNCYEQRKAVCWKSRIETVSSKVFFTNKSFIVTNVKDYRFNSLSIASNVFLRDIKALAFYIMIDLSWTITAVVCRIYLFASWLYEE